MDGQKSELGGYDSDQVEMMKEECILVDENDNILGKDSKINCHINEGKLHRAFSVLLFNTSGELLIQKRAKEKITFPSIWANSCCSHPLHIDSEINGSDSSPNASILPLAKLSNKAFSFSSPFCTLFNNVTNGLASVS